MNLKFNGRQIHTWSELTVIIILMGGSLVIVGPMPFLLAGAFKLLRIHETAESFNIELIADILFVIILLIGIFSWWFFIISTLIGGVKG